MQIDTYFGPDNDREIAAKKALMELQERYRKEAEPFLKILVEERAFKIPTIIIRSPVA